jgi:hypothetical protein
MNRLRQLRLTMEQWWVLVTMGGFMAGSLIALVTGYLGSILLGGALVWVGVCNRDQGSLGCMALGAVLCGSLGLGITVGSAQWGILRRSVPQANGWITASGVGWVGVGSALVWLSYSSLPIPVVMEDGTVAQVALLERFLQNIPAIFWAIASGAFMGLLQGLVLRPVTLRWTWWIHLNALLLAIAATVLFLLSWWSRGLLGILVFLLAASPIYAVTTSKALVWSTSSPHDRSVNHL